MTGHEVSHETLCDLLPQSGFHVADAVREVDSVCLPQREIRFGQRLAYHTRSAVQKGTAGVLYLKAQPQDPTSAHTQHTSSQTPGGASTACPSPKGVIYLCEVVINQHSAALHYNDATARPPVLLHEAT